MKSILCVITLVLSLTSGRHRQQYGCARVVPALCRPEVAPYGCHPVPRKKDVIDLKTFGNTINGKVNSVIWRIDGIGFLQERILPTFAARSGYEITEQNTTRIGFKFRPDSVPDSPCVLVQASNDIPDGTLASSDRAIMDFDILLDPPLGLSPFRLWIVSDFPDQYIFEFGCRNRTNIIDGVCYDRWFLDIIFTEGKSNNPPMHKIVKEMEQKFGLKFDDPRNTFMSIGYECPGDILP